MDPLMMELPFEAVMLSLVRGNCPYVADRIRVVTRWASDFDLVLHCVVNWISSKWINLIWFDFQIPTISRALRLCEWKLHKGFEHFGPGSVEDHNHRQLTASFRLPTGKRYSYWKLVRRSKWQRTHEAHSFPWRIGPNGKFPCCSPRKWMMYH